MQYDLNKKIFILALIGILLCVFSFLFGFNAQSQGITVVINELAWAGSSYSASDEFIELKNLTNENIDLGGWYLTKLSSGEEKVMLEISQGLEIEAGGFFVISNFDKENSVLNIEPDLIDSDVSLSNSSLQIKLYNSQNELIDVAGGGDAPFFGDNEWKTSMIRKKDIEAGDLPDAWTESLVSQNLDDNVSDFATPKAENFLENELDDDEDEFASDDEIIIEYASDDVIIEDFASEDITFTSNDVIIDDYDSDDEQSEPEDEEVVEEVLGKLMINEVAFKESQDWVELKVIEQGDFNHWKLFQGESLIFEIDQDEVYDNGDFILLNLEKNLTGTDNILVLRNAEYQTQDVLIWSNNDGKFTKSSNQANFLATADHWLANNDFENDDSSAWQTSDDIEENMSLARVSDIDTNSANDWSFTYTQTPGLENEIALIQTAEQDEQILEENDEIEEQTEQLENEASNNEAINLVGKLFINEVVSQPFSGQTEWIEIFNSSDLDIEVTDCYLQEGSGTKFHLKGIIPSKFYMIVKTKNLNNAGDMVQLYSKDDQLLDQMIYGSFDKTMVDFDNKQVVLPYALVKDSTGFWKLTTLPTPGTENIVQQIAEEDENISEKKEAEKKLTSLTKKSSEKKITTENPIEYIALTKENIGQLKDDDLVLFEGVITVNPGLFLKQRMYLQSEDLAVEAYFYKADWPSLQIGQRVKIKGKFAKKEMSQIKISSAEDINVVEGQSLADLKEFSFQEEQNLIGFLIAADGEISEKLASGFNLVTEQGDLPVCFRKNAGLNTKDLENGQRVFVSGILLPYKENVCLYPRLNEDISVLPSEQELGATVVEQVPMKKTLPVKIILTVVAAMLSAGLGFLYLLKKGKLKIFNLAKSN